MGGGSGKAFLQKQKPLERVVGNCVAALGKKFYNVPQNIFRVG
jgi:hypothetical protein